MMNSIRSRICRSKSNKKYEIPKFSQKLVEDEAEKLKHVIEKLEKNRNSPAPKVKYEVPRYARRQKVRLKTKSPEKQITSPRRVRPKRNTPRKKKQYNLQKE